MRVPCQKQIHVSHGHILAETSYKTIVAKRSEGSNEIAYDGRGNLLSDSVYDYTWDLKNRLVAIKTGSGITDDDAKVKLEFEYDPLDRRTKKLVYSWDAVGNDWQLDETIKFIYDGWLLLAEVDENDALVRSYIWGLDKSGTLSGAGASCAKSKFTVGLTASASQMN